MPIVRGGDYTPLSETQFLSKIYRNRVLTAIFMFTASSYGSMLWDMMNMLYTRFHASWTAEIQGVWGQIPKFRNPIMRISWPEYILQSVIWDHWTPVWLWTGQTIYAYASDMSLKRVLPERQEYHFFKSSHILDFLNCWSSWRLSISSNRVLRPNNCSNKCLTCSRLRKLSARTLLKYSNTEWPKVSGLTMHRTCSWVMSRRLGTPVDIRVNSTGKSWLIIAIVKEIIRQKGVRSLLYDC